MFLLHDNCNTNRQKGSKCCVYTKVLEATRIVAVTARYPAVIWNSDAVPLSMAAEEASFSSSLSIASKDTE